jgi:hypothetical protein
MFYQDLDDDTVDALAKDLRAQSFGAYWSTATYAAWRYFSTTYILATWDKHSTVVATRYLVED